MRSRTAGSVLDDDVMVPTCVVPRRCLVGLVTSDSKTMNGQHKARALRERLPPQDAAQGSAHDGAANGIAHRSADRLAEIARDLAGDTVHDRAGHVARDMLADRQPLAAQAGHAEDIAECRADAADPAADAARLARLLFAAGRRRRGRAGLLHALEQ